MSLLIEDVDVCTSFSYSICVCETMDHLDSAIKYSALPYLAGSFSVYLCLYAPSVYPKKCTVILFSVYSMYSHLKKQANANACMKNFVLSNFVNKHHMLGTYCLTHILLNIRLFQPSSFL